MLSKNLNYSKHIINNNFLEIKFPVYIIYLQNIIGFELNLRIKAPEILPKY